MAPFGCKNFHKMNIRRPHPIDAWDHMEYFHERYPFIFVLQKKVFEGISQNFHKTWKKSTVDVRDIFLVNV